MNHKHRNRFQSPGPALGTQLTPDGVPIRGGPVLGTDRELRDLPVSFDAHVKVFDLSVAEDLAEYQRILDEIVNQVAFSIGDRIEFDSARGRFLAFLRWAEPRADAPASMRPPPTPVGAPPTPEAIRPFASSAPVNGPQ